MKASLMRPRLAHDYRRASRCFTVFKHAYGCSWAKHRKNHAAMATIFTPLDEFIRPAEPAESARPLQYGWGQTPVGQALLAWDEQGVRSLILAATNKTTSLNLLVASHPEADLRASQLQAADFLKAFFAGHRPLPLSLEGTAFQRAVWRGLMDLAFGEVVSYAALAQRLGRPSAARAVGNALAANRIGFLVPCHRVVPATGAIGQFRWGSQTKAALLAWEQESQSPQVFTAHQC